MSIRLILCPTFLPDFGYIDGKDQAALGKVHRPVIYFYSVRASLTMKTKSKTDFTNYQATPIQRVVTAQSRGLFLMQSGSEQAREAYASACFVR